MIIKVNASGENTPFVITGHVTDATFNASLEAKAIASVFYEKLPGVTVREIASCLNRLLDREVPFDERDSLREEAAKAAKECEIT